MLGRYSREREVGMEDERTENLFQPTATRDAEPAPDEPAPVPGPPPHRWGRGGRDEDPGRQ